MPGFWLGQAQQALACKLPEVWVTRFFDETATCAEAGRDEYGFLPAIQRQRATIIKPGTMILSQPEIPIPLVTQFPFPAWATRPSEAGTNPAATQPDDPFEGLPS